MLRGKGVGERKSKASDRYMEKHNGGGVQGWNHTVEPKEEEEEEEKEKVEEKNRMKEKNEKNGRRRRNHFGQENAYQEPKFSILAVIMTLLYKQFQTFQKQKFFRRHSTATLLVFTPHSF